LVPGKAARGSGDLFHDLRALIEKARQDVARKVNSALVMLYWKVGQRIQQDILKESRAEYGQEIVPTVSAQLAPEFGEGFGVRNLFRMIKFAEIFSEEQIVSTLSTQLSWSHFVEILMLKDELQRHFYAEMCKIEGWSVRTLRKKISSMLYERTALSKKPDALIQHELKQLREGDKLTPDLIFRDPYFLDFLGLKNTFRENSMRQLPPHGPSSRTRL